MYESFYGFSEKPFSLFPDHRFLFLNRRYKLALSLLEFGVLNKNGMILLTGDPGIGKTTLLHKILADLDETVIVGHMTFTHDKDSSILLWVLNAFGLPPCGDRPTDLFQSLTDFFAQTYQESRSLLLVVDEAQNLDVEKLEELRLLFNLNDRQGPVFQILLAGHTQLRERLRDPQLSAFVQRIGTDFSLDPLGEEDTIAYVRHRVLLAGGSASLFSEKACELIFRCTKGTPRLINQLCETCLIYGFSDQATRITEICVADVAKDRLSGGIFPLTNGDEIEPITSPGLAEPLSYDDLQQAEGQVVKSEDGDCVSSMQSELSEQQAEKAEPKQPYTQALPILPPKQVPMSVPVNLVTNPGKYWEEGLKLRDEGWCLEAIQSFKLAATHSQYRTSAWFQVGQCYLVLGRKQEALKAIRHCLKDSTSSATELARIHHVLGELLEDMGELDESQRHYQLARSSGLISDHEESQSPHSTQQGSLSKAGSEQWARRSWVSRLFRFVWD